MSEELPEQPKPAGRRRLKVLILALVSAALLYVLFRIAGKDELTRAFRTLNPWALAGATGLYLVAAFLSVWRWQFLLRHHGIEEGMAPLGGSFLVSMFFGMFLPSASGGDAVRVYEVARRRGSVLRVLLATMQERMSGFGMVLLVGVFAVAWNWGRLPGSLGWVAVLVQSAGVVAVVAFLYPKFFVNAVARVWDVRLNPLRRLSETGPARKLSGWLQPLREAPALSARELLFILTLAFLSFVTAVVMYKVPGDALGIEVGVAGYCLIVPLVWVVRNLPVSLNGIGMGEGAFMYLLGLYGVPAEKALALALSSLALQTVIALLGGAVLLGRMSVRLRAKPPQEPVVEQRELRHAA